ncbi:hypothetical protein KBB68_04325 [Candidatus Babeliales bacterium]|nr:hypothetical protein [Candidatus Babeliales bacterium]
MKLLYIILLALYLNSITSCSHNKREIFRKKNSLRITIPEPENIIPQYHRLNVTYDHPDDWSLFKVIIIGFFIGSSINYYQKFFYNNTQELKR